MYNIIQLCIFSIIRVCCYRVNACIKFGLTGGRDVKSLLSSREAEDIYYIS